MLSPKLAAATAVAIVMVGGTTAALVAPMTMPATAAVNTVQTGIAATYSQDFAAGRSAVVASDNRLALSAVLNASAADAAAKAKAAPKPTPTPTPTAKPTTATKKAAPADSTPVNTSTDGLDVRRSDMWDRVAKCESGNRWNINTGNGYFGGLQFKTSTWLSNGGGVFAPRADLATREQQITIANKMYDARGLAAWACKA